MKIKLVRDRIGVRAGHDESVEVLPTRTALQHALAAKLHEEAAEIARDLTSAEEYADLLQALIDLAHVSQVPWAAVEQALRRKRLELGGFRAGRVLVSKS